MESVYPESLFGGFTDCDGTIKFYVRVQSLLPESGNVLDVGCGRGEWVEDTIPFRRNLRILQSEQRHVIGIDFDTAAADNPYIDEFRLLTDEKWPIEDNSIKLIVCDWVVEHLKDPTVFFAECFRVLESGGYLCLRTTNRWGYVGVVSRIIPNELHTKILGRAQSERQEQDVFPTFYRCNQVGTLRRQLSQQGFETCVYGHETEPRYLNFSGIAYRLGVLYQKLAPRGFSNCLLGFARKP